MKMMELLVLALAGVLGLAVWLWRKAADGLGVSMGKSAFARRAGHEWRMSKQYYTYPVHAKKTAW